MALKSEALVNLKIQVNNDVTVEAMEVEEDANENNAVEVAAANEESELEEGELSGCNDDDDEPVVPLTSKSTQQNQLNRRDAPVEFERRYENKSGAFVTGIDIFSKDGKEKLEERAKRFGLDPSTTKPLSEEKLLELYQSLGMKADENPLDKQGYRLDTIHIRGTEEMSTEDVFKYFREYGPASIEWINDTSCNVVWLDAASPARALLGMSSPIVGLTAAKALEKYEEVVLVEEENAVDEDLAEDPAVSEPAKGDAASADDTEKVTAKEQEKASLDGAVRASDIRVPIPPGMWRLGTECRKSKCILLRYATRSDRKFRQAEKLSEYYKRYGNPNYGGIRGIISTSRKRKFQSGKNPQHRMQEEFDEAEGSKNPWGSIAQNWGTMDRSHVVPGFIDPDDPLLLERPVDARMRIKSNRSNPPPPPPTVHSSDSESSELSSSESSDEADKWRKRLKGPHMKMYADQEEEKLKKRRKKTAKIAKKNAPPPAKRLDLRNRIGFNAQPSKPKAPSVWARLENIRVERQIEQSRPEDGWSSEDEEVSVLSKMRSQVHDLRHALSINKKSDNGDDLRAKIMDKKSTKKTLKPYEKSPLRIEISNDEYCGDSKSSSSVSSGSSDSESSSSESEGSSSSGSSSESGSSSGTDISGSSSSSDEDDDLEVNIGTTKQKVEKAKAKQKSA